MFTDLSARRSQSSRGFSLVELLVVIAILGILASLIFAGISRAKAKGKSTFCLNNGKQMMVAIHTYAGDQEDRLPPNPDDGNTIPGHNWISGRSGKGGAEEFNPDIMDDPARNMLHTYLGGNISVFRCPGDTRIGLYTGSKKSLQGKHVPATRSFSMNQAVGTICPGYDKYTQTGEGPQHAGQPTLAVNGRWLNGDGDHRRGQGWATYGTLASVNNPSMTWILVDENLDNLNDASFAFGMARPTWFDLPGTYHLGGGGFAFADGHTESHKWQYSGKRETGHAGTIPITDAADLRDYQWIRARTSEQIAASE